MKLTFVIVLLFVFSLNAFSVNDTLHAKREHYLRFGISGGWFAVKDYETSVLTYRGFLPGLQTGVNFSGKKTTTFIDYNLSYGHLVSRNYPSLDENRATSYNTQLIIGLAARIKPESNSGMRFSVGGCLGAMAEFRDNAKFNNASFNYEGIGYMGPVFLLEKELNVTSRGDFTDFLTFPFRNRKVKISALVIIPVINEVVRPPYPAIDDFVDGVSPYFSTKKMKLVSFGKLFGLNASAGINYYLHNGNIFMLNYQWYYYNYHPQINDMRTVAGFFSFSFVYKLNK